MNGCITKTEKINLKYFNTALKYQFESVKTIDFSAESSLGTKDFPVTIQLNVLKK
jgi:hypothetical protein